MVFEKVRAILADQLDIDPEKIQMDSRLLDDLGADSLDVVDLVMAIEDEFSIEVSDEALENMTTIADAVNYIEANI
jgi:acyl carrier protein